MGLADSLRDTIKSNILKHLIIQRPFPADQLLQVFLIAFQQKDHVALRWFAGAVFSSSSKPEKSQFKRLAQEISVFALYDRGEGVPLIPDDPQLSALLRFAQLRVAVATDEMNRAATLLDKALFESSVVQERERQYLSVLLWATVLVEPHIPMPPNRWLSMLLDFTASPLVQSLLLGPVRPTSFLAAC